MSEQPVREAMDGQSHPEDQESTPPDDRVRRFQVIMLALVWVMAVVYVVLSLRLPLGDLQRPGPGFFPTGVGGLLVVFAGSALVFTLRRHRVGADIVDAEDSVDDKDIEHDEAGGEMSSYGPGGAFWRIPVITSVMVAYILIANRLGHLVAATCLSLVTIRLLGSRPWWQIVLLGAGLAILTTILFEDLLGMRLPRGSWNVY